MATISTIIIDSPKSSVMLDTIQSSVTLDVPKPSIIIEMSPSVLMLGYPAVYQSTY